jgi:hypothetical protein
LLPTLLGGLALWLLIASYLTYWRMSLPIAHKELIQAIACVLSDPHYEKRWFGLDTIADICNSLSPDGLAVNKTTTINAFKISGGLFFALFPFSEEELVLAVR